MGICVVTVTCVRVLLDRDHEGLGLGRIFKLEGSSNSDKGNSRWEPRVKESSNLNEAKNSTKPRVKGSIESRELRPERSPYSYLNTYHDINPSMHISCDPYSESREHMLGFQSLRMG